MLYSARSAERLFCVRLTPIIATLACLTGVMEAAYGQSDDEEALWELPLEDLGQIRVVSIASGTATPIDKAAAVTSVITAGDIRAMGPRDLEEVLETIPGIHVARNSIVYTPVVRVRGISSFYGAQTLFMINGVPIQSLYVGNPSLVWAGMPLKAVRRIEVIRGPGSALYGADAFAGAINIITMNASDLEGVSSGLVASDQDTRGGWMQVGQQNPFADWFLSLELNRTDGQDEVIAADAQSLLDGGSIQASLAPGEVNTGREQVEMRFEAGNERWTWRMGYQGRYRAQTGAGVNQALSPDSLFSSDRVNTDLTVHLNDWQDDLELDIRTSYYYNDQQAETNNLLLPRGSNSIYPEGSFPGEPLFPDGVIGNPEYREAQARIDLAATYSGIHSHSIRFGLGGFWGDIYNVTEQKNFGTTVLPGGTVLPLYPRPAGLEEVGDTAEVFLPEKERSSGHIYLQDEWQFAQNWSLTTGVRYDNYSDFNGTLNPRAALVWATTDTLTTKLLYGTAFRAPTIAELFVTSNPVALGNPEIEPEKIRTIEMVVSHQVSRGFRYSANIYSFRVSDFIDYVLDTGTGASQAQNSGRLRGRGAELEMEYQALETLKFLANYAYQETRDVATDCLLGGAPAHQAYARMEWEFEPLWLFATQGNWIGKQARQPGDNRSRVDDSLAVDLVLSRRNLVPDLDLLLSVRNVLDQDRREASPGPSFPFTEPSIPEDFPLAGRTLYGELSYRF